MNVHQLGRERVTLAPIPSPAEPITIPTVIAPRAITIIVTGYIIFVSWTIVAIVGVFEIAAIIGIPITPPPASPISWRRAWHSNPNANAHARISRRRNSESNGTYQGCL